MEKVYVLDKANVEEVAQLFSLNKASDDYRPISRDPEEKFLTLLINKEELKNFTKQLKAIFEAHPGSYNLYMKIGGNIIRTQTSIDWNEEVKKALDELLGEGRVID